MENHTAKGKIIAAASDPIDTYREINKNRINVPRAIKHANGASTTKQPAVVATPFPPSLNFINSGYRCPKNAARATTDKYELPGSWFEFKIVVDNKTGTVPFKTSPKKVSIPSADPATRLTLVVPIFPLP